MLLLWLADEHAGLAETEGICINSVDSADGDGQIMIMIKSGKIHLFISSIPTTI